MYKSRSARSPRLRLDITQEIIEMTIPKDSNHCMIEAGQAAVGPTCHKCGKLVETGDVLCDEHEQEMIKALIAASKAPASGQKG